MIGEDEETKASGEEVILSKLTTCLVLFVLITHIPAEVYTVSAGGSGLLFIGDSYRYLLV